MKLTTEQVNEIRTQLAEGAKQVELAQKYGVSQATISLIKNGKSRKDK